MMNLKKEKYKNKLIHFQASPQDGQGAKRRAFEPISMIWHSVSEGYLHNYIFLRESWESLVGDDPPDKNHGIGGANEKLGI